MLKSGWARVIAFALLCSFLFGALTHGRAAEFTNSPYVVKSWSTEQGLPQSSVISITQGQDGYLWLGTLNGLVRFDGLRFKVFDEGNTPGLDSSRIVKVFEDSRGNLWVGTDAGGVSIIKRDGHIKTLKIGGGNPAAQLMSVSEAPDGTVWLNMADGELARYSSNQVDVLNVRCGPVIVEKSGVVWLGAGTNLFSILATPGAKAFVVKQVVPVDTPGFLLASRNGGFWRLADGHVQRWNDGHIERDLGAYPWGNVQIQCACEDHKGNLIVGTQGGGVFWYDAQGQAARISSAQGLSHNTVLSVCMDQEGDLWVGTDGGGLDRVKRKSFRVLEGSPGLTIQSVCSDGAGGVWFANFGGPLSHWAKGVLKQYAQPQGLQDLYVRSVFVDRDHQVWAGTTLEGLFVLEGDRFHPIPNSRFLGPIYVIFQDHAGRLWFGAQGGLTCREGENWNAYTTKDGMSGDSVRAIAEDKEGNLWIGTERSGLDCLRHGKFTVFRKSETGLPSDNVSSLLTGSDGALWVGTSAGLARHTKGKWTRYTASDGLASNGIGYLIEDEEGNLWIGSYVGLMRVTKQSLNDFAAGKTNSVSCRVYGEPDGLPTPECTQGSQPAACQTVDGRLWFASIRGLASIDPSALKPNLFSPPVIIESVLVQGREQNTNALSANRIESVVIPPGQERLEIHYTSLNLGAADQSRFKYWLQGHERGWTEAGNSRVARYPALPPGQYEFHVRACNEDGVWSKSGATLAITVLPPFWQTWWFLSLVAAGFLGMVVVAVHFISTQKLQRELALLRQQEVLEKERARIARDLHDQLGANLMQVALLGELAESDKHQPEEVEEHAQQITQTARETTKSLDEIVWAVNPSNDTLDGLVTYVCKYAQEYLQMAGLRYRLDVPAKLPDVTLPPEVRHNVFLAAKEAINNIVKHAEGSSAWLRLRLEPDRFVLEIEDDGRGPGGREQKAGRNGLRNMRKRMEDVGGDFSIGSGAGQGTLIRLSTPIRKL